MFIQGSIRELRAILDRAIATEAQAIHFIFPNHIIAVSASGEYSYFKTALFLSHTMALPIIAAKNLQRFFKLAWKQRNKSPSSPFYNLMFETVTIKENCVEFDRNPDFTFEIATHFSMLPAASDFITQVESIGVSSIQLDRPYLKVSADIIHEVYRPLKSYTIEMAERLKHLNLNCFEMPNRFLVFTRDCTTDQQRFLKSDPVPLQFDTGYTLFRDYSDTKFPIYDLDIITLHRLAREWMMDTVVLIPFDKFCIIEGHGGNLLCKFHIKMELQNNG